MHTFQYKTHLDNELFPHFSKGIFICSIMKLLSVYIASSFYIIVNFGVSEKCCSQSYIPLKIGMNYFKRKWRKWSNFFMEVMVWYKPPCFSSSGDWPSMIVSFSFDWETSKFVSGLQTGQMRKGDVNCVPSVLTTFTISADTHCLCHWKHFTHWIWIHLFKLFKN